MMKKQNSSMESDNTKHVAEWLSCDVLSESTFGWPLHKVIVPMNTQEACVKSEDDSKSWDVEEAESTSPLSRPGWPLLRIATSETMTTTPARDLEAEKMSVVQWVMGLPNRATLVNLQLANFSSQKDSPGCRMFPYAEIRTATCQFSSGQLKPSSSWFLFPFVKL